MADEKNEAPETEVVEGPVEAEAIVGDSVEVDAPEYTTTPDIMPEVGPDLDMTPEADNETGGSIELEENVGDPVDIQVAPVEASGDPVTREEAAELMTGEDNAETSAMTYSEAMVAMSQGATIMRASVGAEIHLGVGFTSSVEDEDATDWVIK